MPLGKHLSPLAPLFAASLFLISCGSVEIKSDPTSLEKVNAPQATVYPTEQELNAAIPTLLLLTPDISSKETELSDLGDELNEELSAQMSKTGVVVKTNNQSPDAANPIIEAINAGKQSLDSTSNFTYLMRGFVSNKAFKSSVKAGYFYKDDDGKSRYQSPECMQEATLTVKVEFMKLPNLLPIAKQERTATSTNKYSSDSGICEHSQNTINHLYNKAAKQAIENQRYPLMNLIAIKGYVLDVRKFDETYAIKVNLGSTKGAEKGKDILLYKQSKSKIGADDTLVNVLSNKYGEGEISDRVSADASWIVIDKDETNLQDIAIGDVVKILFDRNMFGF